MDDDRSLLTDFARHGDGKSLTTLITRHSKWMMAMLGALLPTAEDAEDAFQEAWLKVIRSASAYRGGSIKAYLASIARSVAIDLLRKQNPTVSLDDIDACDEAVDPTPSPDANFVIKASKEEIRRAVRGLPLRARQVLLLRIEAELTFGEIAEELDLPIGTVLSLSSRATMRLRKELVENGR